MATAGGKPWRGYCALALPLHASLPPDKVSAATARAADMTRRDEEFLLSVLDKAARRADVDAPAPSIAGSAATATRRLCALLLLLEIAVLMALAVWAATPSHVQRGLLLAGVALTGISAMVHLAGWLAAHARSLAGVRVFLLLSVAVAATCALARRELELVRGSQEALLAALREHEPQYKLTEDERASVLDGGADPALMQRFVFDGPAWFLSRLEQSCAAGSNSSAAERESTVGLVTEELRWDFENATCVEDMVDANMDAEAAAQIALALLLAALTVQAALVSMLLLFADRETFKRQSARSKRRARRPKRAVASTTNKTTLQPLRRAWSASIQLVGLAIAGMAIAKVVTSWQLLDSCALDASVVDSWVLASALGSGFLTLVGLLLVQATSRVGWGSLALCCGIAFDTYALSQLASLSGTVLPRSDAKRLFLSQADLTTLPQLEPWFDEASRQRCSIVVHWLSHICLSSMTGEAASSQPTDGHSTAWDPTCQHEFAALLADTVTVSTQFLAVLLALELTLMALVLLPLVHHVGWDLWTGCCSHWRRCWARCPRPQAASSVSSEAVDQPLTAGKPMQQASLEYSEALTLYLSSVRSTSKSVREAERAAFEDEWARLARRPVSAPPASAAGVSSSSWLPSYRTMALSSNSNSAADGVVITQRDFEAIVRTLLIRRLITRCKMDVSVSLSSDGRLLFLRLSAPDNVLMARLCDLDEYELEFADAVDPGQTFWRQRGEMESDRKVLEPHEVKQQFKLLHREAAADTTRPDSLLATQGVQRHDLEWFRGESLVQVSARIHVLHRVSRLARGDFPPPSVSPWHHVAARVRYSPRPQLQFLYKRHPNRLDAATGVLRRASVLRTVDCLRLTRLLLDEEFDVDAMLNNGLLASFQCLHSASRMDFVSRAALASSWVAFWRRSPLEGTPISPKQREKTRQSSDHHRQTWWRYWCCCLWVSDLTKEAATGLTRWSPYRQPVQSVRDYFGERVAFFIAWSGLLVQLLALPALAVAAAAAYATLVDASLAHGGALATLWSFYSSPSEGHEPAYDASGRLGALDAAVGVAMVLWALVFAKAWERQSAWYQLKWGSRASSCMSRPTGGVDGDEYDLLSLPASRLGHQAASWCCVTLLAACNAVVVLLLVLAQGCVVSAGWVRDVRAAVVLSCASQAVLAQWLSGGNRDGGSVVSRLATRLSKWEGHEDGDAFQRAVALKLFVLQLASSLTGLLLLLALGVPVDDSSSEYPPSQSSLLLHLLLRLPSVGLLGGSGALSWLHSLVTDYAREIAPTASALVQLQTLLALSLSIRIAARLLALVRHASEIALVVDRHSQSQGGDDADSRQLKTRAATLATSALVEAEHELRSPSSIDGGFADAIVDLALVSMFSSALPVAPLVVFIDMALALRVNAVELSCLSRRPEPEASDGVGLWAACVRTVVKLAVATTVTLVDFRPSWATSASDGGLVERVSRFLVTIACCWLAIELLWVAVPGESGRLAELRKRHAFLVQRYVFGDDGGDGNVQRGGGRDVKGGEVRADDEDVDGLLAGTGAAQGQADGDVMLESVHERAELLQRLNVAMRRPGEPMHRSLPVAAQVEEQQPKQPESTLPPPEQGADVSVVEPPEEQSVWLSSVDAGVSQSEADISSVKEGRVDPREASLVSSTVSEQRQSQRSASSDSSSSEQVIVGYYRPVARPQGSLRAAATLVAASPTPPPPSPAPSTASLLMGRPRTETPRASAESQLSPPPMKRLSKLFARATPAQLHPQSTTRSATNPATASSPLIVRDESASVLAASRSETDVRERADDRHPLQVSQERPDPARGLQAVQLGGMEAIAEAARRQQLPFDGEPAWRQAESDAEERPREPLRRARGSFVAAGGQPAARHSVTQLEGLAAVREAASRQQFDFSSGDEAGWT